MERNFLLALALSFLVLTLWTMYTGPPGGKHATPPAAEEPSATPAGEAAPTPTPAPSASEGEGTAAAQGAPVREPVRSSGPERSVQLENQRVRALFTTRGGALLHWELRGYYDASLPQHPPVELTAFDPTRDVALATSLGSLGFGDLSQVGYRLDSSDARHAVFSWSQGGIEVRKSYTLEDDSFLLRLRMEIRNDADRQIEPSFRLAWPVGKHESQDWRELAAVVLYEGSLKQERISSARGGGLFGGSFDEEKVYVGDVGWAGANLRYFLAAMVPDVPRDARARMVPAEDGRPPRVEVELREVNVPTGQVAAREYRVYIGPKIGSELDGVGAHLDEAILKGWFPPLTNFFTWALTVTHKAIPNYGLAIILITIVVRMLMYPIMQRQMRSMKRMSAMQPKIKEIQEKYGDDKERQSQEMMKVYKESGFNPLTGCLPMFLQLPVFIGLYYALQGAIQLRQEPFFGWINDLSAPETLFVIPGLDVPVRLLPLLMGGSMVLQTRMTPTTMDPAQARMMNTVMPVMFTFLFYQFASGLVLYWLVSNLLGIVQQMLTNRRKD